MAPAVLRPSSAYIWTNCAAAPSFAERVPEPEPTDAAREGTCAAWLAEITIKSGGMCREHLNASHENGWLVTAEMVNYVQDYVDMLRHRGGIVSAEQRVHLTDFISGTLDASTSGAAVATTLYVDDLKYGFEVVEVYEHYQLLIYAAAELRRLGAMALHVTHVQLGIYQPRIPHPDGIHRTWTLTVNDLWQWAEWIVARGTACMLPEPVATPGRQCKYCRALTTCHAAQATLQNGYDILATDRRQHVRTSDDLAKYLDFLDLLTTLAKATQSAAQAEAESRMKRGEHVRGWFFKSRKGHRVLKYDPALVQFLTGVNPVMTVPMKPPDLERAGVPKKLVDLVSVAPDIGHKLERMPDSFFRKVMGE